MNMERVEITEGEQREANVLLRFDPKEIAIRILGIELSLLKSKPKRGDLVAAYKDGGASDGCRTHDLQGHNLAL